MKTNTFLSLICSVVLCAGSVWGFYAMRSVLAEKLIVVQEYRQKEARNESYEFGSQLRTNLANLSEQESALRGSFVRKDNTVGFIESIESSARQIGLELSIESVGEGEAQPFSWQTEKTLPLTLTVQAEGTYAQVSAFVEGLANQREALAVSSISLYRADGAYTARIVIEGIMISS